MTVSSDSDDDRRGNHVRRADTPSKYDGDDPDSASELRASKKTVQLIAQLRRAGETDDAVLQRALRALDTIRIVSAALAKQDFRKACVVAQQFRMAGYSEATTTAVCRALCGEQSEKDLRKAFKCFDRNSDGTLSKTEVKAALPLMGENVPKEKIDSLMKLVNKGKSTDLSFEDFCTLVRGMNPKGEADENSPFAAFRGIVAANPSDLVPDFNGWTESLSAGAESVTGGATASLSAIATAWSSDLKGLNPLEMRKAGVMLDNMQKAGYSEEKAQQVVSSVLCDQSEKNIKKTFRLFDADGSGTLQLEELKSALPLMGENVPKDKIKALLKKVDRDRTGQIELSEFVILVRGMNPKEGEAVDDDGGLGASLRDAFGQFSSNFGGKPQNHRDTFV